MRPSEHRRAQSRVSKQMDYRLEQARDWWIATETQDETIRRVMRKDLKMQDGRYREDAS
jgi:hypothetical protein